MNAQTIRRKFLEFFESKGHKIVPSAPMVLKNDPSLLFTNSGMVQFKDYFLGTAKPTHRRIADTQKCLRVSGKHNDLEDVGLDTYHHTMFEMLGNWSFGDYFKKEAIDWGWELLTEVYQLPKDRMYVSVFGGDESDGLPVDTEAKELWKTHVSEDRILNGEKKDNFWEMGESGPCGPCSEIHIDLRPDAERAKVPGHSLVNQDHPQVIEIWNLVFIQFNRLASGALEPLPEKHVDTGMGFERLCMAIQGKLSNYDTDVFQPLMAAIAEKARVVYGQDERTDIAIRVTADHIRAVSFAIADGQLPSNTGAGYVIRRILRRAVRYGYSYLNCSEPFLHTLVPILANQMKDAFPELIQQVDYVTNVVYEEEQSFLRTLEKGLKRLDQVLGELPDNSERCINGAIAFELFDTYGFPLDLTELIGREHQASVDQQGFQQEMKKQRARSKADAVKTTGDWVVLSENAAQFVGYDQLTSEASVVRYREVKKKDAKMIQVVLNKTPFYAESGGQVGDTGVLISDKQKVRVLDTKKENDLIVHYVDRLPEPSVNAVVDADRRLSIMCNHSATHLLHAALRQVLGSHVEQKGSLVSADILRFDFSHFKAMTEEELIQVEQIINQKIRNNIPLDEQRSVSIHEAKQKGAMALFGEKYGDTVRMITFDPKFSVELCGGTHVSHTGQIGFCKIITESSVAAGVRRIEAVTAQRAEDYLRQELQHYQSLKEILKNPQNPVATLEAWVNDRKQLEKKLEEAHRLQMNATQEMLEKNAKSIGQLTCVIEQVKVPNAESLKTIAFALRSKWDNLFLVLAADVEGKPFITVMLGEKVMTSGSYHAGNMVKELAREIQGGGGGQPFYATAGGKNLDGLSSVVSKAHQLVS